MAGGTNQKDNAPSTCSSSAVKKDAARDEEEPKQSLVTSSMALIGSSDPSEHQEVVAKEEQQPMTLYPVGHVQSTTMNRTEGSLRKVSDPDPDPEVIVREDEAAPDSYLPPGWTRTKLEPDC